MRFAASPLVVAVALGLLGPLALQPDAEDSERPAPDGEGEAAAPAGPAAGSDAHDEA
jgi:hypothetical protein